MSDQALREAAGHLTGAANSVELAIGEIMAAFREGCLNPEPPGSPAYVRRLRDQAAVAIYAAIVSNPQRSQDEMEPVFDWQIYRESAAQEANLLIAALGYPVPGEESK